MRNGKEIRNIYPFILLIFVFYIYIYIHNKKISIKKASKKVST